jgi:hypothetical protein
MFAILKSIFKSNPTKKLRKAYEQKSEQAMFAQRNGDMRSFAMLTAEAEAIWDKVVELEKKA